MNKIFIIASAIIVTGLFFVACDRNSSSSNSTVNSNSGNQANQGNSNANLVNANTSQADSNSNIDNERRFDEFQSDDPTETEKQLENYVRDFLSKSIPKKISADPQYQPKMAYFRKEADNYIYVSRIYYLMSPEIYTQSSADLRTILVLDNATDSVYVVDTTIPAIVYSATYKKGKNQTEGQKLINHAIWADDEREKVEAKLRQQMSK
jgi:hypothetical protein